MIAHTDPQPRSTVSFTVMPGRALLLQRKCACGGSSGLSGSCSECEKQKLLGQPLQTKLRVNEPGDVYEQDADRLAEQSKRAAGASSETGFSHDFGRIGVHPQGFAAMNAAREDDAIHQPQIEDFRQREDDLGNPAAAEVSDAAIKYRGLGAACPAKTEVDRVVDLTPAGLGAGFLTAYGAMAVMRVRPGERTWDGTRILETVAPVSNTCPDSFAPTSECIGASTFTVGDAGHSDRIGDQPGLVNRFYDFHVSRTRGISRLHDNTRNPQGLNSCETVCQQKYHCDGREIGRHTVTRTFTKGIFGGRDVTLVTVTKK